MVVLPAPVGPTMATFWPGNASADRFLNDRLGRIIAKADVAELDMALRRSDYHWLFSLRHLLGFSQELENTFGSRSGLLQDVGDVG